MTQRPRRAWCQPGSMPGSGTVFVTIDSRDRERAADTPGDYTVRLMEDVRDVCAVKLRSSDIPRMWSVPRGRSTLWVSTSAGGGTLQEVVVEAADHTPATAASALQAALDAATPLTWTVTVTDTGRFLISATGAFSIRGGDMQHSDGYGPVSMGRVLGLSAEEQASDGSNQLLAPHANQLHRPETMYLYVEDFNAVQGATSGIHNCLDVINSNGTEHETPAEKQFHPPLSRVNRLKVRIVDYYGTPVDFDNREHRLDLQFITRDAVARTGSGYKPPRM